MGTTEVTTITHPLKNTHILHQPLALDFHCIATLSFKVLIINYLYKLLVKSVGMNINILNKYYNVDA